MTGLLTRVKEHTRTTPRGSQTVVKEHQRAKRPQSVVQTFRETISVKPKKKDKPLPRKIFSIKI